MKIARVVTWLLLATASVLAFQDEGSVSTEVAFEGSTELYRDQRYGAAANSFAVALDNESDPLRRAVLHYNAGTAAARADRLGEAVWHLEAARRLDPGIAEVGPNLDIIHARLREGDATAAPPPSFLSSLLRSPLVFTPTTSTRLSAGFIALALLGFALWRAGLFGKRGAWLSLALLLAAFAWRGFDSLVRGFDLERAVVVDNAVPVRGERQTDDDVLYRLSAGTIVSTGPDLEGWRRVETTADVRGWVPAEAVRPAGQ